MTLPSIIIPKTELLVARLPLPPGVNKMYKNIPWTLADGKKTSRRAATKELLQFQRDALMHISQAETQNWEILNVIHSLKQRKRQNIPLQADLDLFLETLFRSDIDGLIKAVLDAIFAYFQNHNVNIKDNVVTDLNVKKRVLADDPHCLARLSVASVEEDLSW